MTLIDFEIERNDNPVDLIEKFAHVNDWSFERSGDDEIAISITGTFCDYHLSFSWMEEFEALHLACAYDFKVPEARRTEIARLMALINEQLWLGHFDLWNEAGVVMFRHAQLYAGGMEITAEQIEGLVTAALDASERHYQAFQFVVWAGKSAAEALEATLFETVGEA